MSFQGLPPKTSAEMWSEWLREASVLIAVFRGLIDPFFDAGPRVSRVFSWPTWLVDARTGTIDAVPWLVLEVVFALTAQLLGISIERRKR